MSRFTIRIAALAVLAVIGLAACQPVANPELPLGDNTGTVDASSTAIGCAQATQHLVVSASSHLDPACSYSGGIEINQSHVTLDCRGAHVDAGTGRSGVGILVHSPVDVALTDVTVRNCVVHGFLNGMRVTRDGFKTLTAGHEYDVADAAISIENDRIRDTGGVGLYVDGYVTGVTIDHVDISNAGSTGIYLEAGSRGSTVQNSFIHGNGFAGTTPPGQTMTVGGTTFTYLTTGREGIAVDGSSDNVIRNNAIGRNSYGGIFLYKNCGEYATQKPDQWWPRRTGSSGNLIEGNAIYDEQNGVWIGSRMAENTYFLDCSDPTYIGSGVTAIRLDSAPSNTVSSNRFIDTVHGVRVEDDGNTVADNQFSGDLSSATFPASEAVLIGTKYRTETLHQPVSGTVVTGNRAALGGVATPYAWIHGETGTTFTDDLAAGTPASLGPGTQPTINLFLFVASFTVAS
jgi:parallel beta-helix repeat protein